MTEQSDAVRQALAVQRITLTTLEVLVEVFGRPVAETRSEALARFSERRLALEGLLTDLDDLHRANVAANVRIEQYRSQAREVLDALTARTMKGQPVN